MEIAALYLDDFFDLNVCLPNDDSEFKTNEKDIKLVIINNTKELDEIYMSKSAFENAVDKSKVKKESELFDIPFDEEGNLDLYR